jgi:hypothetical protein
MPWHATRLEPEEAGRSFAGARFAPKYAADGTRFPSPRSDGGDASDARRVVGCGEQGGPDVPAPVHSVGHLGSAEYQARALLPAGVDVLTDAVLLPG